MTYVVTEACRGAKHARCVDVCPAEAFREGPDMLYIDPQACIDCHACITECPVEAIYPQRSLPDELRSFAELNRSQARVAPPITSSAAVGEFAPARATPAAVDQTWSVAIIGAGPAGFYAAEELLHRDQAVRIDLYDRLATPFGLLRSGVAPDHQAMKALAGRFERSLDSARLRFVGNVEFGRDVSRDTLLARYDAVIYATGAAHSRRLGLEGEDLLNIRGAADIVGWYNAHPDAADQAPDLSGHSATIIGMGNVALDIARILLTDPEKLATTDISDAALARLRASQLRELNLIARGDPARAACTAEELQDLLELPGLAIEIIAELDGQAENAEEQARLQLLRQAAGRRPGPNPRKVLRLMFNRRPAAFEGENGRVRRLLLAGPDGSLSGQPAELVILAAGFHGAALPLPACDATRGVLRHRDGQLLDDNAQVLPREFAVGWVKRGARGVLGTNKRCAAETVTTLLARARPESGGRAPPSLPSELRENGLETVDTAGWRRIDAAETARGSRAGRPRNKFASRDALLQHARPARVEAADRSGPAPVAQDTPETRLHFRTCTLCEAMCGLRIAHDGERVTAISGDPDDPHSHGHICPKGTALKDLHEDPDRLRTPLRREGKAWRPIGWDEAIAEAGRRLADIQNAHGNDAVGLYMGNPSVHSMGAMLMLPRLRRALRTRNLFSASSLDQMPHQLASHLMYGHDLLFNIPDVDRCDYMLMIGANPAASNGSLMSAGNILERLQAISARGGKWLLIDPRRTESARDCDEHLFIRPGTDALLLVGLLKVIVERGLARPGRLLDMVDGWEQLTKVVEGFDLAGIADQTGIEAATIRRVAEEFASAPRAICYGRMGVSTQPFGALNHWLINLLNIVTGNLDRPGGMMFSTPAADLVPLSRGGSFDRYRSRTSAQPEFGGEFPTAVMAEEMLTPGHGQIRALVTHAGNPVLSSPNGRRLETALEGLEFMLAIDFYVNETTRHADLILPPTGPLEHSHYDLIFNQFAVRNRARYSPRLFAPAPGARADWQILRDLSNQLQARKIRKPRLKAHLAQWLRRRLPVLDSPRLALAMLLRFGPHGPGLNPFARGLTLSRLSRHPHGLDLGALKPSLPQRLRTPGKRIQLAPAPFMDDLPRLRQRLDSTPQDRQLLLIGRRNLRSNNSWMHNSSRLVSGRDRCTLLVNPVDGARLNLDDGATVRLRSRVGEIQVPIKISDDIAAGVVCLPHGWGHHRPGTGQRVASANHGVSINDVTDAAFVDALSGNAAFNGLPVEVIAA